MSGGCYAHNDTTGSKLCNTTDPYMLQAIAALDGDGYVSFNSLASLEPADVSIAMARLAVVINAGTMRVATNDLPF